MVVSARLKEVCGDVRSTYASKAMQWVGDRLIVNAKDKGMPYNFWWDQEDRHVLKGDESSDPRYQRLQVRTDDFRRYLKYGVGRLMPVAVPLLSLPIILAGYLALSVLSGVHGGNQSGAHMRPGVSASVEAVGRPPADMEDSEIAQAVRAMGSAGKTEQTLNDDERAIVAEARRRGLMN